MCVHMGICMYVRLHASVHAFGHLCVCVVNMWGLVWGNVTLIHLHIFMLTLHTTEHLCMHDLLLSIHLYAC